MFGSATSILRVPVTRFMSALLVASSAAFLCAGDAAAQAQFKPSGTVRIIVGYTPGGSTDVIGRQVGAALSKLWGQPVIIENRPGAGGNLGADAVAKAAPDGLTLLMWHDGLAANAGLYKNLPFDPIKDLAPIATIARVSIVMGVANNFPAKSVKEVIEAAKAQPGKLSYASCGNGTPHHIAGEMLKSYVDLNMIHVPYKGCAPALNDIVGGHIPVFFQTLSNVTGHMKSGSIRVLAVADPARVPEYPDLPTMIEAGVADYTVTPWYGIFGPGTMSPDLVARINADINHVVQSPELQALLRKTYYQPETSTPEQFRKMVQTDIQRLGAVIRKAGISAD